MLSSKKFKALKKYIEIIEKNQGKTLGQIQSKLKNSKHDHFKKGASGLIIENLLGLKNNSSPKADLEKIKVEVKVLPIQLDKIKAKEPTQIKMINYLKVVKEKWENAEIREKIETILWIAYGVKKKKGEFVSQNKYILLDWFIDAPDKETQKIFKKDWENIQTYIANGKADELSCSMGEYIEPKTKGRDSKDLRDAPDGKGGTIKVRRRAFYFKKDYTNSKIISELDIRKEHKK